MASHKKRRISPYSIGITGLTVLLFFAILTVPGCKKDDPPAENPPVLDGGVYVLNEGNYQWGNGSMDYVRKSDWSYSSDIFQTVNQSPLGDVVQSMTVVNGLGYLVVNNSGKIEIVEMAGFTSVGQVSGLTSPRYMLPVNAQTAYVSDLYSNSVHILDMNTRSISGEIPLKGSSEGMLLYGDKAFVSNTRRAFVYIVSTISNTVVDSISTGYASNSLVKDKNGKIWVMCAGDAANSIHASIWCIDPDSLQVEKTFELGNALEIWDKLRINGNGDRLYFTNQGVWCVGIDAASLPSSPLIAADGRTFHGLGIDPDDESIWVSDAADYVQHGKVYRYSAAGSLLSSWTAGIIPSEYFFY
jgi:hypothetical protein